MGPDDGGALGTDRLRHARLLLAEGAEIGGDLFQAPGSRHNFGAVAFLFDDDGRDLFRQAHEVILLLLAPFTRRVPVRDLKTDEHADNDNQEIEPDREPVLRFDVFGDAAEEH